MNELFDLAGKIAVVTGGSRGLGRAIAIGLAKAGADVVVTARIESSCEPVVREIEQMGRKALALACEMANPSDIDRLVNKTYVQFGRCDVLVNNAGVTQDASPLMESTQQFFDQVQAVNVNGPMQLAIEIAKRMADSGGGSIINIVSTAALQPVGHMGAYSASKAALRSLTAVMAEEWALMGIRVNAIAPGPFLTDMMSDLEQSNPGFLDQAARNTLLKRIADPAELVGPVIFLASSASSYVTGQTLSVCGGAVKT